MNRPPRLMYVAGPGDIVGTYRHWKDGYDDPSQVSVTYSGQFFDVCRGLNAEALVISSFRNAESLDDGQFHLRNKPLPFGGGGLRYHLAMLLYGLQLLIAALRFGADYMVIAEGSTHWFLLYLLPRAQCRIIPSVHCVLWPVTGLSRVSNLQKFLLSASRRMFRRHAYATLSASDDITSQINELAHGDPRRVVSFLPSYRPGTFSIEEAPPSPPFRMLFAGRIETEKGVFTLLEVARMLRNAGESQVEFDLCGAGSALEALRAEASRAGLASSFRCHGHCSRTTMSEMFKRCHVVVVPTTTQFGEGFNQVVVESVLGGRPVVTSVVCPSRKYVSAAVVEVPPDEASGYAQAILDLYRNHSYYEQKRAACAQYAGQFYDEANGWGAALRSAIQPADSPVT